MTQNMTTDRDMWKEVGRTRATEEELVRLQRSSIEINYANLGASRRVT